MAQTVENLSATLEIWVQSLGQTISWRKEWLPTPVFYYSPRGHKNLDTTEQLTLWAFLVTQMIKNLPAVKETQVWSLGQEDPLEKGMATHSRILVWRIPRTEEPGRLKSMGWQRVGHDWATNTTTKSQDAQLTKWLDWCAGERVKQKTICMEKKCIIDYGMKLITKSEYLNKLECTGESSVQRGWSK